jgi:hypothetical protein
MLGTPCTVGSPQWVCTYRPIRWRGRANRGQPLCFAPWSVRLPGSAAKALNAVSCRASFVVAALQAEDTLVMAHGRLTGSDKAAVVGCSKTFDTSCASVTETINAQLQLAHRCDNN